MKFDVEKVKKEVVDWIRNWFESNGKGCNAVIGISGGKDSTVGAALCVEALGRDRVIGVLMPNGMQEDLADAWRVVEYLKISSYEINIADGVNSTLRWLEQVGISASDQTKINIAPRERLKTLRAASQSMNGRVVNTCNLSEDWVGYSTIDGDNRGDFGPLSDLTQSEVKKIGYALGLPVNLVNKTPSDGLCGKTDEENLGFSYNVLDKYIRTGICDDEVVKERIDYLHKKNAFKMQLMPKFEYKPERRGRRILNNPIDDAAIMAEL